ncbi:uncharacterized protein LOC106642795 [Copidosoma floridanum]|uniref:uncharacterized protein LOC106642795 n=1 Tax=Copidosoma floridanum TaxID=29053 RepID=UPI0006C9BA95|nr:uncharacterized protein LOC106642795 [Copidosoma floridanum]
MSSPRERDTKFIEEDLVPELVSDRCFCESNSREFVELESVAAEPLLDHHVLYRATIVIRFSDVPTTFRVLIKLLPADSNDYGGFLNEEMIWNKGTLQYGKTDFFPRFYAADMGRYAGRAIIVVEDLRSRGFRRAIGGHFDNDEARLAVRFIGRFHARGLRLRRDKFPVFREFYAKFEDTLPVRRADLCQSAEDKEAGLERWPSCTICQGLMTRENLWFRRDPDTGEPVEVRPLDWQRVRLGPGVIDLETLLAWCSDDAREALRDLYVDVVREEVPEIGREELLRDSDGVGKTYADIAHRLGGSLD